MKALPDIAGIASIKIRNLLKEDLSDKELRQKIKEIVQEYGYERESRNRKYIKELEEEVKDFRTIKRLLK